MEQELSEVTTLRKMVLEHNLCAESDMSTEGFPSSVPADERFL
jgi:hypothetical protein